MGFVFGRLESEIPNPNGNAFGSLQSIGGPMVVPQYLTPLAADNISRDWFADPAKSAVSFISSLPISQPNYDMAHRGNGGVTKENYQEVTRLRIEQRERELGRKLSPSEAAAILDAYRQLAGLDPVWYEHNPTTGSVPKDVGGLNNKVLSNPYVQAADTISKTVKDANIPEAIASIGDRVLGTTSLIAVAAIVLGIIYLRK